MEYMYLCHATAEPDGYSKEKEKGNVKTLGPGKQSSTSFLLGALEPAEAEEFSRHIEAVLESRA